MANGGLSSKHEEIQVFKFSEIKKDSRRQTPLFKTNFYQLGFFEYVEMELSYFGRNKTISQKNIVVMMKPGQTISFEKTDPNPSGFAVMFKESFIDWHLSNSNTLKDFPILNPESNCIFQLTDEQFKDFIEITQRMYHEYNDVLNGSAVTVLKLYSHILIEKISRYVSLNPQPFLPSIQVKTSQEFKNLVYQNIHKTKSVADYAEMLFVTEKTLINHMKSSNEMTPKDFINSVIIEESKALLRNKVAIDDVADYFNFTDLAHFSNFFKKKTGISPVEFKKK